MSDSSSSGSRLPTRASAGRQCLELARAQQDQQLGARRVQRVGRRRRPSSCRSARRSARARSPRSRARGRPSARARRRARRAAARAPDRPRSRSRGRHRRSARRPAPRKPGARFRARARAGRCNTQQARAPTAQAPAPRPSTGVRPVQSADARHLGVCRGDQPPRGVEARVDEPSAPQRSGRRGV